MSRRRVPKLAGLLALGALVGGAMAFVLRRRRQQWEEYDPVEALSAEQAERVVRAAEQDKSPERLAAEQANRAETRRS